MEGQHLNQFTESVFLNLERLSRSSLVAKPGISALEQLWFRHLTNYLINGFQAHTLQSADLTLSQVSWYKKQDCVYLFTYLFFTFVWIGKGPCKFKAVYPQEAPTGCGCFCWMPWSNVCGWRCEDVHCWTGARESDSNNLCRGTGRWSGPCVYGFSQIWGTISFRWWSVILESIWTASGMQNESFDSKKLRT